MITFCKLLNAHTAELHHHFAPADISEVRLQPGNVIWLDIQDADDADMALLAEEFGFHPLAIEDCRHAHQRPKLDEYDGYKFIVLYDVAMDPDTQTLQAAELNIFFGPSYVVTVHKGPVPLIDAVQARWEVNNTFGDEGASYLAYLLIDAAVDSYFPAVDAFSELLDTVEVRIFDQFDENITETIFDLKRDTLTLRRLVTPLRDVFLVLLRGPSAAFGPRTYAYFQDVLDHLLRVSDSIDVQRDLVGSALDAYQSAVSNRTNDTMKKLTVLSTVLMTGALIAGIYGMNFAFMPELVRPFGYYGALYMMLTASLVLVALFRWKGYIGGRSVKPADPTDEPPSADVLSARRRNVIVTTAIATVGTLIVVAPFIWEGTARPLVTKAEFAVIKRGMTIDQIERAVGSRGRESAAEDDGTTLKQTYIWLNADGSHMTAHIENARLVSKAYERLQ